MPNPIPELFIKTSSLPHSLPAAGRRRPCASHRYPRRAPGPDPEHHPDSVPVVGLALEQRQFCVCTGGVLLPEKNPPPKQVRDPVVLKDGLWLMSLTWIWVEMARLH